MNRETGFYRVKRHRGTWEIGHYDVVRNRWNLRGYYCSDEEFEQIDESRINPEPVKCNCAKKCNNGI